MINYTKASEETKRGLDQSRVKEWTKWQRFGASTVATLEQAHELVQQGAEEIGTQWIETDKNEHLRSEGNTSVEPLLKSRLVALGNH